MPCTVAVPEPFAPTLMSDWYQETPNGLSGNWMTNRSKSLLAGCRRLGGQKCPPRRGDPVAGTQVQPQRDGGVPWS
jgi:hypothetical protein